MTETREPPPEPFHRLEELTKQELDSFDRDRTVILLPVAPVEEHGPHLPLGTDGLMAAGLAEAVLRRLSDRRPGWHLVLAPWLPIGCYTLPYVGSIEVPQAVVRDVVLAYGSSLARHGFGHIVVIGAHGGPGHSVAIEEACRTVSRRHRVQMIYPLGKVITDFTHGRYGEAFGEALPGDASDDDRRQMAHDFHAGAFETSVVLANRPELVKGDYRKLPPVKTTRYGMMRWFWGDRVGRGQGYMGVPHLADPVLGRRAEELLADEVTALVRRMMDGEDLQRELTSEFYRMPIFRTGAWRVTRALYRFGQTLSALMSRFEED